MASLHLTRGLFVFALLLSGPTLYAADAVPGEDILPENSIVSMVVPDLRAAQAQFDKSRLAEIFAQPMMQDFLQPVLTELKKQEAETLKANPGAFTFSRMLFDGSLAGAFFASPRDPGSSGVIVIFTPKAPADFMAALPAGLAKSLRDGTLAKNPQGADVGIDWIKDRLVFCAPSTHLARFKAQLSGTAAPKASLAKNPDYMKTRERLSSSVATLYLAPQGIFALAASEIRNPVELTNAQAVWSALGMNKMNAAGFGLGIKNGELIAEGFAGLSAPDAGLFGMMYKADAPPANVAALRVAAVNAPYVAGGYFNFAGILPLVKSGLQAADPRTAAMLDAHLQSIAQTVQFDIQKDFLENIDGAFVAAQTESNTSLPILSVPGMVYSFGAKNPAKLEECLGKLDAYLGSLPEPLRGKIKLKRYPHLNKTIFYLSGPIFPLSPALCLNDGRFLVGTSLNAMRRTLEQLQKTEDITANKKFQQAIARITEQPYSADKIPAVFSYGQDQGSGEGALLLAGAYLSSATMLQVTNASLPVAAGVNVEADIKVNETAAMANCMAFAEAQEIYHRTDYDKDGVLEYAQAIKGDSSLLETKAGKDDLALVAKTMADAEGEPDGKTAFKGYRFKILKSATVAGANKPYVVNGNMTLGYALLAYPVQYGASGKHCFIISNAGTIYSTDWGQKTAEKAAAFATFDPTSFDLAEDPEEAEPQENRAQAVGMAILRKIDLGFWPDQAFFDQYRRPVAASAKFDQAGIYWRTELPPPMPAMPRIDAAPVYVATAAIGAGLILPVLARARESARRTSSASNLNQIAKAAFMYADVPANGGKFPAHPAQLYPNFVADARVFRNPRFGGEDVGYIWVSGVDPEMATAILAYEQPPPTDHSGGRNVVIGAGTVEWVDDARFAQMLEETQEMIKKAKREMKLIPASVREIQGDKGVKAPEF